MSITHVMQVEMSVLEHYVDFMQIFSVVVCCIEDHTTDWRCHYAAVKCYCVSNGRNSNNAEVKFWTLMKNVNNLARLSCSSVIVRTSEICIQFVLWMRYNSCYHLHCISYTACSQISCGYFNCTTVHRGLQWAQETVLLFPHSVRCSCFVAFWCANSVEHSSV